MNEAIKKRIEAILLNPMKPTEIFKALGDLGGNRGLYRAALKELVADGKILKIRGGRYGALREMNLVVGRVQARSDRYGFLIPDDPGEPDIYLGSQTIHRVMDGDRAVVRIERTKSDGSREGSVARVLERAIKNAPGEFESIRSGGGIVHPFDTRAIGDIFIPGDSCLEAKDGDAVIARIVQYPDQRSQTLIGQIESILGAADSPAIETDIIIAKHQLRSRYPEAALREARAKKDPSEADIDQRLDARGRVIVTIDGANAKDFDDAIDIERSEDLSWKLGVHIADVSHYVEEDSELDIEARARGVSTYFPDRVVPMLPEELSNEICSLKPKVDRLTMSVLMEFDPSGRMKNSRIEPSIIRSVERMGYNDVAALIERSAPGALFDRYGGLIERFDLMAELAMTLRKRRLDNGAIDFDLPIPEVTLDIRGATSSIALSERNIAHKMIEEFMLIANKAVAETLARAGWPILHRVHEAPDELKLETFFDYLESLGAARPKRKRSSGESTSNIELNEILRRFENRPEEKLVTLSMLRAMKQARYSEKNIGHFGLAFENYLHFTSPIRRYPDLIVHRLVKDMLSKRKNQRNWRDKLPAIGVETSRLERISEEAERESLKASQVRYMADKIGERLEGIISGVTSFGFFVELSDTPIEGLVRLTSLNDDYYIYDETRSALIGKRTRKIFKLGDAVKIIVSDVSIRARKIEFKLDQTLKPRSSTRASRRPKREKKNARGRARKGRRR